MVNDNGNYPCVYHAQEPEYLAVHEKDKRATPLGLSETVMHARASPFIHRPLPPPVLLPSIFIFIFFRVVMISARDYSACRPSAFSVSLVHVLMLTARLVV